MLGGARHTREDCGLHFGDTGCGPSSRANDDGIQRHYVGVSRTFLESEAANSYNNRMPDDFGGRRLWRKHAPGARHRPC
jgi:hypothetical protein